jgi:hypothetical protein
MYDTHTTRDGSSSTDPAAHMAASLRPPSSHAIRPAAWHLWNSSSEANEGAMRIPRPAVEKLGAFREDPVIHV